MNLHLYHRLPIWSQNLAATCYGAYLHHQRYGGSATRYLAQLMEHEDWSIERLQDLQLQLLRSRAALAVTAVPAYENLRDRLDQINGAKAPEEILECFPILTKDEVRLQPEAYIPRGLPKKRLVGASTSGTTGTPLRLFRTVEGIRRNFAFFGRVRQWRDLAGRDRAATLMGRLTVPSEQSSPPFWRYSWLTRNMLFSSYHMSADTLPGYVDEVFRFNPIQIVCYPSSGALLAQAILEKGRHLTQVRAIFTTAETLLPEQRDAMEAAFGAPVADQYGSSEWTVWISQCEFGEYHLHPESGWPEIIDPQRRPLEKGCGRLVATGFVNNAMVLMRYDTGDALCLQPGECDCGRAFPRVRSIEGRMDDLIRTPSGRTVGRLDPVFKGLTEIRECQLVQTESDRVIARLVPGDSWGREAQRQLVHALLERLGPEMEINVEVVASIPRTSAGKFRSVIGLNQSQRTDQVSG